MRRITKVVNIRDEEFDVFCQRPSKWSNPFIVGRDGSRTEVIRKYGMFLAGDSNLVEQVRRRLRDRFIHPFRLLDDIGELRGLRLGCGCKPKACHCDILAILADFM